MLEGETKYLHFFLRSSTNVSEPTDIAITPIYSILPLLQYIVTRMCINFHFVIQLFFNQTTYVSFSD